LFTISYKKDDDEVEREVPQNEDGGYEIIDLGNSKNLQLSCMVYEENV
jgi:hypothetical protein